MMTARIKTIFVVMAVAMALAVFASSASAAPPEPKGKQLNASQCNAGDAPLVNVTFDVVNDADSGVAENVWATDSYNKQIQVWAQGNGTFCAIVRYEGRFVTLAGASPGGGNTVAAGIQGTLNGGYQATFNGIFAPTLTTNGNIGSFDYACNASFVCPGRFDWVSLYFPGYTNFDQPYWAWTYHAGSNGSWLNASTGNLGDITGN